MLAINKHLVTLETEKIPKLGKEWESHIPKRPDFPDEYVENRGTGDDGDIEDDNEYFQKLFVTMIHMMHCQFSTYYLKNIIRL